MVVFKICLYFKKCFFLIISLLIEMEIYMDFNCIINEKIF